MEARVLAVAERVAERARGLAHAHGDGAAVLDLLQGVLGVRRTGQAERQSQRSGAGHERLLHWNSCND